VSNTETTVIVIQPSNFDKVLSATKRAGLATGHVLKIAGVEALQVTEAAVLTVAEPIKAVGVTTGRTFMDKYTSIDFGSDRRQANRAAKRAAKAAAKVVEAERILAESRIAAASAVVVAPAPAPKPSRRTSKSNLTTVPSS
jgi:hypothetical protein